MPGIRMQSARLAHSSSCCSLKPVFAASSLRPFAVRAASSRLSMVRIPADLSLEAAKAVRPSILEIGYVMILNVINGALGELAEAGCPCHDLAHLIRPNCVSAELEKFTSNALNSAHAQTKPHQLAAERHQSPAHQSDQPATAARGFNGRLRAWNSVNQGLNYIGGTFV